MRTGDGLGTRTVFRSPRTWREPRKPLILMVPRAGLEPACPCGRRILSPVRLPIPPPGHRSSDRPHCRAIAQWPRGRGRTTRAAVGHGWRPGRGLRPPHKSVELPSRLPPLRGLQSATGIAAHCAGSAIPGAHVAACGRSHRRRKLAASPRTVRDREPPPTPLERQGRAPIVRTNLAEARNRSGPKVRMTFPRNGGTTLHASIRSGRRPRTVGPRVDDASHRRVEASSGHAPDDACGSRPWMAGRNGHPRHDS